jgi:AcrR family transcriptional regulator
VKKSKELPGSAPALTVISATPEKVLGRMIMPEDASGTWSLGLMVDFASRLAVKGVGLTLADRQAEEIECYVSVFSRRPARELNGEAIVLHREGAIARWRVSIRDGEDQDTTTVSLIYAIREAAASGGDGANTEKMNPTSNLLPHRARRDEQPANSARKRRDQIAAAAAAVIARKGFANATMREIADMAGMHVPTMYQYVASKDEMLELVYNWTMARVRTDVAAATVNCSTATEKLRATITSLIAKGDRFRRDVGVLNREFKSLSSEARLRVLAHYRKLLLQIAELVSEGIAGGEFRPVEPEIAANFIEATCDIWPLRQFAVGQFGQNVFHDEIAEMIIRGLGR